MPIGLDQRCLDRLRQGLAERIPEFKLRNGWNLDRSSLSGLLDLEKSLPNKAALKASLETFINETPFFDYVYGELSKEGTSPQTEALQLLRKIVHEDRMPKVL